VTRSNPRLRSRRGASLIELVLIIGSVTIILGICGMFLHLLLRLDRSGRGELSEAHSVARLCRQFREDVRAARTAHVVTAGRGGTTGLDLSRVGKSTVNYRTDSDFVVRVESAGSRVLRREGYKLGKLGPPVFEAGSSLVSLILPRRPGLMAEGVRPGVRVEATVGKDYRIAAEPEAPK
jgi:hypothetical protein